MELIKESFYHVVGVDELTHKEHTHPDTYELIQVLSGEGEFIIDSKAYHFQTGSVLLIDAEWFHYSMPQDPKNYVRNKLIIKKNRFISMAQAIGLQEQVELLFNNENNHSVYLNEKNAQAVDKSFHFLCNEQDPFQSATALIDMIHTLWANIHPSVDRNDVLAVILDAVNESIGNEFSLDVLSSKIGVSKYYLCHYFKAKTGMTILDYLKWKRIDLAKRMLGEKKVPISEIAFSCGYNSLAYFSKCFKDSTGMTPKEYVKTLSK